MKKVFLLFFIIILTNCTFNTDPLREERIQKYWIEFEYTLSNPVSIEGCSRCIKSIIKYKGGENPDCWQYPGITLEKREGDCEDIGILFLAVVYSKFGIKGEGVFSWKFRDGDFKEHFYVRIDGKDYYKIDGYNDMFTIPYDRIPYWIESVNY